MNKWWIFVVAALLTSGAVAKNFDYQLKAVNVAANTYVFVGESEDFSFENGGNIVNTGFIVTDEGVIVIDTGPSLRYGQQMIKAISNITDKPINRVYLTHHHPDHFLGNSVFKDVPIYALEETIKNIKAEGAGFADNLYLMVGDWMRGTDVIEPTTKVSEGRYKLGGHDIEVLAFSGHTSGDLAILDHTTGVLFAGDLIFHKRTLTTPHADVDVWLETIKILEGLNFSIVVPGHGPVSNDKKVFNEMSDYLSWLDETLNVAASEGLSMMEIMQLELPKRFQTNALLKEEFSRTIVHLYAKYEKKEFIRAN